MTQKLVVKFQKCSEGAVGPTRAHETDAGWDLYYCGPDVTIPSGSNAKLGTGLRIELPMGYYLQIANRSGVATKMGLLKGAEICDFLYNGEIIVNLHNPSSTTVTIESGMKIAQCLLLPVPDWSFEEASADYTLNKGTLRAEKGFGSSGI